MNDDLLLIQRSLAGSTTAFEELMKRHERLVFKVAFAHVRNVETAMDISQNTFVKAYGSLGSYRREGHFKAWLAMIASRESLNWLRTVRGVKAWGSLDEIGGMGVDPTQAANQMDDEIRGRLLSAMGKLNPRQRTAVSLRYFDGASLREIADSLSCDVNQAKNILFRSLEKLRRQLGQIKEYL